MCAKASGGPAGRRLFRRQLLGYRHVLEGFTGGGPGAPTVAHLRTRHDARLRLTRAAEGHRASESANGLEDAVVHDHGQLRQPTSACNEWHGTNAFIRDGDQVFRTYFIDARGDEQMGNTWNYLDITALGRQEEWEDSPEGYPQTPPYNWWKWHDAYDGAQVRRSARA